MQNDHTGMQNNFKETQKDDKEMQNYHRKTSSDYKEKQNATIQLQKTQLQIDTQ